MLNRIQENTAMLGKSKGKIMSRPRFIFLTAIVFFSFIILACQKPETAGAGEVYP